MQHLMLVACVVLAGGCLEQAALECADGTICPLDKVCIPGGCALPEQVASCEGQPDGESCTFAGIVGQCMDGLCLGQLCGNGEIDPGEACDDGNTLSGEGDCRADCSKLEVCGDAVLDTNEGCDDGNANPADGCDACRLTAWSPFALIGGNANARAVGLFEPAGIAFDVSGNLFIADRENNRVHRVDPSGVLTTIAGTGEEGFSGDGGTATSARLREPHGVAVDGLGNVYIADRRNFRIRRVDPNGIITTIAGGGSGTGDGGPATGVDLSQVAGVAVDGLGNVYFAEEIGDRIRRVDTSGLISTVAGTGNAGLSGDGGPATAAMIKGPTDVDIDALGQLYIVDSGNHRIRRVDTNGTITTIAGATPDCGPGFCAGGYTGDGGPATAALLDSPDSAVLDAAGNIYVSDLYNARIRRIDTAGTITTVAGTGVSGFNGDGPAASAELDLPMGLAIDGAGVLHVADSNNNRIRSLSGGMLSSVVGSGAPGYSGDGGAATSSVLRNPTGIITDAAGNLYIAEETAHRVRRVSPDGVITTVAGTGTAGYRASDEGGLAITAQLASPRDVLLDAAGNLYISDSDNHRVRKVDTAGIITTIAGTGVSTYDGDGALATTKALSAPTGLAFDNAGNLLIADRQNNRIRRIDAAGIITTIAGTGTAGFSGDNQLAINARLNWPWGLAVHGTDIYLSDTVNHRIRRIDSTGKIDTVAGSNTSGYGGDGGAGTSAQLLSPRDISVDAAGNLYIADLQNNRVRRLSSTGTITTFAGTGVLDSTGDGGPNATAAIGDPLGVHVDGTGAVYISARIPARVRRVSAGTITTVAGSMDPQGMGPVAQARLADPRALVLGPSFSIIAGGATGTLQLVRPASVETAAGRYMQDASTGALARFRDATFGSVEGVAFDGATNTIYFTETSSHRIHAVTIGDPANAATWTLTTLANAAGVAGTADGAAATARFRDPSGLYLDGAAARLYVADAGNHTIRAIDLSSGIGAATVSTIAGVPATRGFFGDGGAATGALLFEPRAITRCANGDLFIADTSNHRVRRIAAGANAITSVIGDGVPASSGEGVPASAFPVHAPRGLVCDAFGNLHITSSTTVRTLPADAAGIVDGSGAVQTIYGALPRTEFPESVTNCLTGIVSVDDATLRVTDSCTGLLVELRRGLVTP